MTHRLLTAGDKCERVNCGPTKGPLESVDSGPILTLLQLAVGVYWALQDDSS